MMAVGGARTYLRIQAETASPAELILRLYDAMMRDLTRADIALTTNAPLEEAHAPLVHAQDILLELIASLDMSAGDLAQQFADLYQYMYQRLVHANVHKDGSAVREVQRLLSPIREAWSKAAVSFPTQQAA